MFFDNPNPVEVTLGFSSVTHQRDLLNVTDPTFATYDLSHARGPIPTTATVLWQNTDVSTSAGILHVTSLSTANVTFTAVTTVPEPSTLMLAVVGLSLFLRCGSKPT